MTSEKIASRLFQQTPRLLRRYVQRLWYLPVDAFERLAGRRQQLLPPRGRRFDGAEAFERVGRDTLGFFRGLAGLKPYERVLDLGCGIGRIAIPLTGYLTASARYVGLDINRSDIRWCQRHISRRFENFEFVHADVRSGEYHRQGRVTAGAYSLPFDDASFDFVCAISLFTHLTQDAALNYVREIFRVLAPGGRCLLTFFLINQESWAAVETGRTELTFEPFEGASFVQDRRNPEAAIAFDEEKVITTLGEIGFEVAKPILGFWADRQGAPAYQDMIVASKPATQP